jgi:hypothetical protein
MRDDIDESVVPAPIGRQRVTGLAVRGERIVVLVVDEGVDRVPVLGVHRRDPPLIAEGVGGPVIR